MGDDLTSQSKMVYRCRDRHDKQEYAVKVCEQQHIIREKKVENVLREKEVMKILNTNQSDTAPYFVKLSYSFKDESKLYFVMTYCENGELLELIQRVGNFDWESARFYSGEIVRALEHLHSLNIVHRDLKPENILLDDKMHIKLTDFGSAKILSNAEVESKPEERGRKNSFVGTAQYVSPEVLESRKVSGSTDLWALGCIIYQMISGLPPFRSKSEYIIFQKILKLDYDFPDGFCESAQDLVDKLLVIDSDKRLGAGDTPGFYSSIRDHRFFMRVDFKTLHVMTPPTICPFMPQIEDIEWEKSPPGLRKNEIDLLLGLSLNEASSSKDEQDNISRTSSTRSSNDPRGEKMLQKGKKNIADVTPEELNHRLLIQEKECKWHRFAEGNLILKQGLVNKRKGLFPRSRMFLLTTGPHLYYVDPDNMVLKGQIPCSSTMNPEAKNFKTFFVHTPNRTYYLEDTEGYALRWCQAIQEVKKFYYPDSC